ncbi:putative Mannose-6-phosphate isomerase [Blattamonas nauphoetae]|uniref:mannose-6-phosphate isomerase n=1 Tax=Blattamonas nauphoetae TaxID=2049346 RepID=A0ABQ9X284_9EUKA|nr:putative Mannose-6-phosphate isomerase [Blattamonas nauphoetae]
MYALTPAYQTYAWGAVGSTSLVGQLLNRELDETIPYAEYWIGTHPSGCALVNIPGNPDKIPLDSFFQQNPDWIGQGSSIPSHPGSLPFMFKVLSVAKPLSIQAHPDLEMAKELHSKDPTNYPDANHKPELALPLNDFYACVGLRTNEAFLTLVNLIPPLAKVLSMLDIDVSPYLPNAQPMLDQYRLSSVVMQAIAHSSFNDSFQTVYDDINALRLQDSLSSHLLCSEALARFHLFTVEYPQDLGCLSAAFCLQQLRGKPGDGIFIPAHVPHEYLFGNVVEVMACSDNVIRGGLTPKHCDPHILSTMLDRCTHDLMTMIPQHLALDPPNPPCWIIPNISDFMVFDLCEDITSFPSIPVPRIVVCIGCKCGVTSSSVKMDTLPGCPLLIKANTTFTVTCISKTSAFPRIFVVSERVQF